MKDIRLIHVYIQRVVPLQSFLVDVILYRRYIVVDEYFLAVDVAGKAAHAVIHRYNVRVEAAYKIIQRGKRRYLAAGSHVNIYAKGSYAVVRVKLGVGVHGNVAFI